MTNTDLNTVRDDISYVRGLAEAGGKGPLLGGPVLIAAAVWLGLMAVGFSTGQWQIMVAMPIVVAAAYGTAWMVAGAMSKQRWLTGVGLLSYAGAVLVGLTAGTAMLYLVFTAFLIACALLPGVILTRMAAKGAR